MEFVASGLTCVTNYRDVGLYIRCNQTGQTFGSVGQSGVHYRSSGHVQLLFDDVLISNYKKKAKWSI